MDKRMQRAKINAASTLMLQLVSTFCGIVIPWVMIDAFGSVAYGATTSIAQFLSYITLFEGGIGRVARGALYKPLADRDEIEISKVYLVIKRFFSTIGMAFVGYTVILAFCYHDIADVTEFSREYIFAMVIAISIGKFAEYMGGISNITLFNADQRQYVVNSVIIVSTILNAILVVLLVNVGFDLLWVKLGSSLIFILKPLLFNLYLKKNYRIVRTKERAILKNKWTGLGQHMAYFVQNNTDIMILTLFADLKAVAVYSIYHLICFSIRNITTSFTGGMEAVFGDMIAKGEYDMLRGTYRRYKLILTVLTITLFGTTAVMIVPFAMLYTSGTTDANYSQPLFSLLLTLSHAINCLILPCFNLPIAAGKLKESKMGAYGEAVINFGLSFILVFWNPLVGIAIGTLASAVFKGVFYIVFSGKYILNTNVGRLLRDFFVSVASLSVISIVGRVITAYVPLYNYWRWTVGAFFVVIAIGIVSVLIGAILYPGLIKKLFASIIKKRA